MNCFSNLDEDYISYSEFQKLYRDKVLDYYKNIKFNKFFNDDSLDVNHPTVPILRHYEGDCNIASYKSYINNILKIIKTNNDKTILFNPESKLMIDEKKKLNFIIRLVNKSITKLNDKLKFKLNENQIKLLDKINIYYLCDSDLSKYLNLKLKDDSFISQKVIILNSDLEYTIVNNVFSYYLCKENTFDENGKNEPYDLPIPYIYKNVGEYGIINDTQKSKIVARSKPPWRSSILVFRSGINVSTGSPNIKMADFMAKLFVRQLRLLCGLKDLDIGIKACQNIVAAAKIKFGLCLILLANNYGKSIVSYNPDNFAGAIVKLPNNDDKITLLVFKTRKIICVGAKNEDNLKEAYEKLYNMLLCCKRTPENIKSEFELIENQKKKNSLYNINGQSNEKPQRGGRGRGRIRSSRGRGNTRNIFKEPKIEPLFQKRRGRPPKNRLNF